MFIFSASKESNFYKIVSRPNLFSTFLCIEYIQLKSNHLCALEVPPTIYEHLSSAL